MEIVGLRELRQDASELVRRVEAGAEITITVSGRPSARLVPARPSPWRPWGDLADIVNGPDDPEWDDARALLDDEIRDPWEVK